MVPLVIPPTGKNLKVVSSILCMAILIAQRQSESQGEDHDTLDSTQSIIYSGTELLGFG